MCLVLIALDAHPDYRLIVAANRDESHQRPAQGLHWWSDRPDVAGGRDVLGGGTWMAARADGRCAAVLNDARVSPPPGAPSRGNLVPEFLDAADPGAAIEAIQARAGAYAGFHFVGVDGGRGWCVSRTPAEPRSLEPGLHGLDNDGLDSGGARLAHAQDRFASLLRHGPAAQSLLGLLADDSDPGPGGGDRRPVFVLGDEFGTRCSTVLRIDSEGHAELVERRFDAAGQCHDERRLEWALALAAG
jgi:uncharacterized protein with NRDE domain